MDGIVLSLQSDCLNETVSVSTIVRKAYVVARKLELVDFTAWVQRELNGYNGEIDDIPDYRELSVDYKAFNPSRGWIPVFIPSNSDFAPILRQKVVESIEQIEQLLARAEGAITFRVNADLQQMLTSQGSADFEINGNIAKIQFYGILKSVRNNILEWTLELEKNGVLGVGLAFTQEEVHKAAASIVNHGTIIYGNVAGSQVVGHARDVSQNQESGTIDLEGLASLLEQIKSTTSITGLTEEQVRQVEAIVEAVKAEMSSSAVKPGKIQILLASVRSIFENVVGNVVASGVVYEIAKYLPH